MTSMNKPQRRSKRLKYLPVKYRGNGSYNTKAGSTAAHSADGAQLDAILVPDRPGRSIPIDFFTLSLPSPHARLTRTFREAAEQGIPMHTGTFPLISHDNTIYEDSMKTGMFSGTTSRGH